MAKSDELRTKINLAEARKEASHESSVEIEITDDDWIISILEVEKRSIPPSQKKLQKVPRRLREKEENKGYFDPRVVSIGPYHHGKPELKEAEKLKTKALWKFIAGNNVEPHEIYKKMVQVVSDARKCYIDGSTDAYDDVAFARMMLLDGYYLEVCSYIYFMNSLINGAEDVMELRTHNIIHNFYGTDEELAKVFNSMATGGAHVSIKGPIKEVSDQIQKHYNSTMKTWTAQLFHNYFNSPWSAVAFFAATFALVLTFIQTFFPR